MITDVSRMEQVRAWFEKGDYAAAEPGFREALQEDPDNPQLLMMLGLCLRGRGNIDDAVVYLQQASDLATEDSEPHLYLARALLDKGDDDAAVEAIKQCLAISPNHVEARTLLGQIDLRAGRPAAAMNSLRAALRVEPGHIPALAALAMALLESGRTDEARQHARQAVEAAPDDVHAQTAMARVYQALGHHAFAEQCMRNVIRLQPGSAEAWSALGGILAQGKQHQEAAQAFGQAIMLGASGEFVVLSAARSLQRLGRLDEAQRFVDRFLRDQPEHLGARFLLAEIHLDLGRPDQAGQILDPMVGDMDGELPGPVVLLKARLAEARGDHAQAHALTVDLFEHEVQSVSEQARLLAGRAARARGSAVAARKALMPLIESGRCEPEASWSLADAIAASGQIERASEILEKLVANERDMPPVVRSRSARQLALLLDRAGAHEQASRWLDHPGWRRCEHLDRILKDSPAPFYEAYRSIKSLEQNLEPVNDGRLQPIFLLGWPGSGCDLLLAALQDQPGLAMLDPALRQRRRDALGLPLTPEQVAGIDEGRQRVGRRRFLAELSGQPPVSGAIEPCWWEAASLPTLARYFPGAQVILPQAEPAALELYWAMAGYRDIEQMLAAKREDDELLDHLRPMLSLKFIEVELERLLDQSDQELTRLGQALNMEFDADAGQRLAAAVDDGPYQQARHWPHYRARLSSGVSLFDGF
ncbi:MAG: tetratricopeptide repeat protein [Wenzhouxiangella sp.]